MRTTVDLTDEAYHLAKAVARERNVSLGKVVSEFILRPVNASISKPRVRYSAAGFPLLPTTGKNITSEDVRTLLDEDQ